MTTLNRISAALAKKPAKQEPALPLDMIRDYLLQHPLSTALHITPREIHTALLRFHEFLATKSTPSGVVPTNVQPRIAPCALCNSSMEIDQKNGALLCSSCGCVRDGLLMHGFVAQTEPDYETHKKRSKHIPGVSDWIRDKFSAHSEPQGYNILDDLAHWNGQTFCHPEDTLKQIHGHIVDWTTKLHHGFKREVCIAVALFYPLLKDIFLNPDAVYKHIQNHRKGITDAIVIDPRQKGTFRCTQCSEMCFTKKDARLHCKWKSFGPIAKTR